MRIIKNLKDYVIQSNKIKNINKKYLNNSFLDTATFIKSDKINLSVNYITNDNAGIFFAEKEIKCNTITVPKVQKSLEIELSQLLYNKYIEMAKQNDKSFLKRTLEFRYKIPKTWIEKIRKYVYSDDIIILENDTEVSSRRLITKIIGCSNNIAMESKIGPANFIVISQHFVNTITNSGSFFEPSDSLSEYTNMYQYGKSINKIGYIADMEVFVNCNEDKPFILVGRKNSNVNQGGAVIVEYDIKMDEQIHWTGAIDCVSESSKYMFDILNIKFERNLTWLKKILNKFLKFKKIYG